MYRQHMYVVHMYMHLYTYVHKHANRGIALLIDKSSTQNMSKSIQMYVHMYTLLCMYVYKILKVNSCSEMLSIYIYVHMY